MSYIALLPVLAVLAAAPAQAATCYRYGQPYYCNGGLGYGPRIGIGLGVAAAVLLIFLLIGCMRRRSLKAQFSKYRPPVLPVQNEQNQYANNPPPPTGSYGNTGSTNWNNNSYGANPPPPAAAYQPSTAGQYGAYKAPEGETQEHGYEWEQAREQERLEREQGGGANIPPPGYEVANSAQNTGTTNQYAPPPGPPPSTVKRSTEGTV